MAIADPATFNRIFGPRDDLNAYPGRSILCKSCGGWHALDKPIPHNCRKERLTPSPLAAPMLTAPFGEFRTSPLDDGVVIGDRKARREYMARNDLVDYDPGITNAETWVDKINADRQWVADFKAVCEMDPLAREPIQTLDRVATNDPDGIAPDAIEVIKDVP